MWGALTAGCFMAGVLFLRFWTLSRDRLFLIFAVAFWIFAGHWLGFAIMRPYNDVSGHLYWVRFLVFALIIVGIVDKNRSPTASDPKSPPSG
ncbi:MAG TPA: DUF5985 family protein [Polyangiaceae bacterium]|jgi:hypothetical protein